MSLSLWTRLACPALMCALLVSCSSPDGPDIDGRGEGYSGSAPAAEPAAEQAVEQAAEQAAEPEITLSGPGQLLPVTATAEIKGLMFDLEVARTPQEQSLGLMFRSDLPDNRGMLFPFETARRASFWMKDVPVALDMVFIRNGEVIAIAASVPPCPALPCPAYGPGNEIVDSVLELRSGRAAEIDLQVGDSVIIQ